MHAVPPQLDHLVLAGPALREAIAFVEERLGSSPLPGGRHPDWGTSNAILPLGPATYLEVIGPDPEAPTAARPTIFDIASLAGPRLVTWAAKGSTLAQLTVRAQSHHIDLGSPRRGSRVRPDGASLTWELTDPFAPRAGGILPFFIDWQTDHHPASSAPAQVKMMSLRARHPDPSSVVAQLGVLNIELEVEYGATPGLVAVFQAPAGRVTLL